LTCAVGVFVLLFYRDVTYYPDFSLSLDVITAELSDNIRTFYMEKLVPYFC